MKHNEQKTEVLKVKCECGTRKCWMCNGMGYYPVQNGPEDFDTVVCVCPIGQGLQEQLI